MSEWLDMIDDGILNQDGSVNLKQRDAKKLPTDGMTKDELIQYFLDQENAKARIKT